MVRQNQAYLYAIATILLWSTIASAFKISLKYIDYFQLLFLSSVVSSSVLFTTLVIQKKLYLLQQITRKDILNSAVLGLLNPFLYYIVLLKAYTLLKAQEAGTLNYIWPITLVLLSVPILKQRIHWMSIFAVLISFTGILIISTEGKFSTFEFKNPMGVFLAISSSLFWALYWIMNIRDRRDEVAKLFLNFCFGSVYVLIPFVLFSGFKPITWEGVAGSLYIGLFEMGITFVLWLKALTLSSNTAKVSNLVYLSPFISLIIIRNVIGEQILATTIIGLTLIIAGILVQQVIRTDRRK
ncbi:MAG: EamA/RhaT family transporter [Bacteroidetes bacterium]|nr:EamA/RhaT family transporter [Bacteroidota bacterium]